MKKKIKIFVTILLALVAIFALWEYIVTKQIYGGAQSIMTSDECIQKRGEIVNTIGEKTWNDNQIIGAVTDLRCPCLCIKKSNNSGMFLLE